MRVELDQEPKVIEARKALHCLYLAVDSSVADDVNHKVEAAFEVLNERYES